MSISKNKLASDIEKNQTIKPAEQHFIQPTRETMENDQLAYYAYTRIELTQRFLDKYRHRQKQASQMTEEQANQMTEVQEIPKKAAPAQAPPQPALSEKDQKNLRKEMEKKKKAGLKLTPGATCYTIDLMEQMKKDVVGREDCQDLINETVSTLQSGEEEGSKREERIRRFGDLLSFAPQTKLDQKTKHITPDSYKEQKAFLERCKNDPQTVVKEFKKKMFAMEVDPDKYTWQYVGEHFQEIHQEQQMLKGFLALFREGTPEYETLRPDEKAKVRMMGDLYAQSNRAFQSALQANGLKYTKYGLTPMTQAELQKDTVDENAADVKALRDSKESLREQLIEDISGTLQEDYDQLRKDMAQDPDTSFITSKRLNNKYQYTTLHEARKLIERDSNKYHANKKLIDILYNEIQNLMESMAIYQDRSKSVEYARLLSEGNKKEEKILVRMGHAVQIKMENLTFRTNCIMDGLRHLMKGDPMDDSTAQVMHQYGYEDPAYEEKIKLTAKYGMAYADNYRKREQALSDAVQRIKGDGESQLKKDVMSVAGGRCLMQINGESKDTVPHNNNVIAFLEASVILSKKIKDNEEYEEPEDIEGISRSVRTFAKEIIKPYIKMVREFDVSKWSQYSDEELVSHQEELMDIAFPGMLILEMGSYEDPVNPQISIMEALISDEKERALFSQNCSLAHGYLKKARALAMRASYINGTLTQDSLLPFEYDNAKDKESGEITEDSLLAYAKKLYIEGTALLGSSFLSD